MPTDIFPKEWQQAYRAALTNAIKYNDELLDENFDLTLQWDGKAKVLSAVIRDPYFTFEERNNYGFILASPQAAAVKTFTHLQLALEKMRAHPTFRGFRLHWLGAPVRCTRNQTGAEKDVLSEEQVIQ